MALVFGRKNFPPKASSEFSKGKVLTCISSVPEVGGMLYYIGRCNMSGDLWRYVSPYTCSSMPASSTSSPFSSLGVTGAAVVMAVVFVVLSQHEQ